MLLQAAGILLLVIGTAKLFVIAAMVLMGLGTGIAYPNFLTVIAENLSPVQRSKGFSVFVSGEILVMLQVHWEQALLHNSSAYLQRLQLWQY